MPDPVVGFQPKLSVLRSPKMKIRRHHAKTLRKLTSGSGRKRRRGRPRRRPRRQQNPRKRPARVRRRRRRRQRIPPHLIPPIFNWHELPTKQPLHHVPWRANFLTWNSIQALPSTQKVCEVFQIFQQLFKHIHTHIDNAERDKLCSARHDFTVHVSVFSFEWRKNRIFFLTRKLFVPS